MGGVGCAVGWGCRRYAAAPRHNARRHAQAGGAVGGGCRLPRVVAVGRGVLAEAGRRVQVGACGAG